MLSLSGRSKGFDPEVDPERVGLPLKTYLIYCIKLQSFDFHLVPTFSLICSQYFDNQNISLIPKQNVWKHVKQSYNQTIYTHLGTCLNKHKRLGDVCSVMNHINGCLRNEQLPVPRVIQCRKDIRKQGRQGARPHEFQNRWAIACHLIVNGPHRWYIY